MTAYVNYFLMVAQLGIPTYGIRACARVRDDKEKLFAAVKAKAEEICAGETYLSGADDHKSGYYYHYNRSLLYHSFYGTTAI